MSPRAAAEDSITQGQDLLWKFELDMHAAQQEIWDSPARFKVVAAGRRFGKTLLAVAWLLVVATSKPDAVVWWVAPTNDQARLALRLVLKVIPAKHRTINRTNHEIYLSSGGRIAFKSGERPDNLRGEGLDLVILDEAAFLDAQVWNQAIRPALADKQGKALLISTYFGENWFYDLQRYAGDPENKDWAGWEFPTSCNPYIPPEEIAEAKRNMVPEEFAQEFEASALSFAGAVFDSHLLNAAYAAGKELDDPQLSLRIDETHNGKVELVGAGVEAGLDWGWLNTALEVCQDLGDGRIAWIDEGLYQRIELVERCHMIADKCLEHGIATIYADAAGATENVTLGKILEERGCPTYVQPVPFNVYKMPAISARLFYLHKGREVITSRCRLLLADSKQYHYAPSNDDNKTMPAKGKDHTVDAATAFYASRINELGDPDAAREAS